MDEYFYDDYDEYIDYHTDIYPDVEVYEPRFDDIVNDCLWPSLQQVINYATKFLIVNLVFKVLTQVVRPLAGIWQHLVSIGCGSVLIYLIIEVGTVYIYGFVIGPYTVFMALQFVKFKRSGYVMSCFILGVLLLCEFLEKDKRVWHQIRGTLMIIVMKIISLAFDIDATKSKELPGPVQYAGYLLCPSNVILGPWNSYNEYKSVFESTYVWNLRYILQIILNTGVSVTFLLCSNCLVYAVIPDNAWKWFIAYRDALAFRCSHYFISFLSQATMVTAGFGTVPSVEGTATKWFGYDVTKPHRIELPRSLVQVVVGWNIPMHNWLKQYVFRIIKPYGTFAAVFSTYVISSILHGLNFQLSAVLISLGFYTFVEYKLRQKLSTIYNSCILANSCKPNACLHDQSSRVFRTVLNILFSAVTIFHLAYLGVMFEAAFHIQEQGFSLQHALAKWGSLDYSSHWIVLISYLFYLII